MRYPINVAKALAYKGAEVPIQKSYALEDIRVGEDVYQLNERISVDMTLRNVGRDLLLTGKIETSLQTACARCLEPALLPVSVDVEEIILKQPDQPQDLTSEGELPETYAFDHERLDLWPVVYQSIILELPLTPLCRPDCRGLCPVCGTNWNEAACDCEQRPIDSRWEALRGLLEQSE